MSIDTWQLRLLEEKQQLDERCEKLRKFIHFNKEYRSLPPDDRLLLIMQLAYMTQYRHALAERIIRAQALEAKDVLERKGS